MQRIHQLLFTATATARQTIVWVYETVVLVATSNNVRDMGATSEREAIRGWPLPISH